MTDRYELNLEYTTGEDSHPTVMLYQGSTNSLGDAIKFIKQPPNETVRKVRDTQEYMTWMFTVRERHGSIVDINGEPLSIVTALSTVMKEPPASDKNAIVTCTDNGFKRGKNRASGYDFGMRRPSSMSGPSEYLEWWQLWRGPYAAEMCCVLDPINERLATFTACSVYTCGAKYITDTDISSASALVAITRAWTEGAASQADVVAAETELENKPVPYLNQRSKAEYKRANNAAMFIAKYTDKNDASCAIRRTYHNFREIIHEREKFDVDVINTVKSHVGFPNLMFSTMVSYTIEP